jgi:hypothetical protein
LRMRTEVTLGPEVTYEADDPKLYWNCATHYLDYLLVIGDNVGFDAILPNVANDPHFVFALDLHQPARTFRDKHANLGFSLDRTMLYLGKSQGKDNVWLAMAPDEFFEQNISFTMKHKEIAPTCLLPIHYWMMVMFFAHVITEALPRREIYCTNQYPDLSYLPHAHVQANTNML